MCDLSEAQRNFPLALVLAVAPQPHIRLRKAPALVNLRNLDPSQVGERVKGTSVAKPFDRNPSTGELDVAAIS